jgi:membrane protein
MSMFNGIFRNVRQFLFLVKVSIRQFIENEVIKYCASLSYYTIFSIAPILIIAIAMGSFFFGKDAVEGRVFGQINTLVGTNAAILIQEMLKNATLRRDNFGASVVAVLIFIVGVTGVFVEIQSSINRIWGLRAKPEKSLVQFVVSRLLSFAMVLSIGFVLVVSTVAGALIDLLNDKLDNFLPNTKFIILCANLLSTFVIITFMFTLIFKFLPDSIVKWKDAFVGAIFTAVLFLGGKYLIGLYLSYSPGLSVYGAAGSVIIMLLWIYYSSILLYLGAEFTKVYALTHGHGIEPNKFSVRVKQQEQELPDA